MEGCQNILQTHRLSFTSIHVIQKQCTTSTSYSVPYMTWELLSSWDSAHISCKMIIYDPGWNTVWHVPTVKHTMKRTTNLQIHFQCVKRTTYSHQLHHHISTASLIKHCMNKSCWLSLFRKLSSEFHPYDQITFQLFHHTLIQCLIWRFVLHRSDNGVLRHL